MKTQLYQQNIHLTEEAKNSHAADVALKKVEQDRKQIQKALMEERIAKQQALEAQQKAQVDLQREVKARQAVHAACQDQNAYRAKLISLLKIDRSKINELQTSLEVAQTQNTAQDGQIAQLGEELEAFKSCGICETRDWDCVLIPCGHPLCSNCVENLQSRSCPWCRQVFSQTQKIFLL